jgi:hypothetical protein
VLVIHHRPEHRFSRRRSDRLLHVSPGTFNACCAVVPPLPDHSYAMGAQAKEPLTEVLIISCPESTPGDFSRITEICRRCRCEGTARGEGRTRGRGHGEGAGHDARTQQRGRQPAGGEGRGVIISSRQSPAQACLSLRETAERLARCALKAAPKGVGVPEKFVINP